MENLRQIRRSIIPRRAPRRLSTMHALAIGGVSCILGAEIDFIRHLAWGLTWEDGHLPTEDNGCTWTSFILTTTFPCCTSCCCCGCGGCGCPGCATTCCCPCILSCAVSAFSASCSKGYAWIPPNLEVTKSFPKFSSLFTDQYSEVHTLSNRVTSVSHSNRHSNSTRNDDENGDDTGKQIIDFSFREQSLK